MHSTANTFKNVTAAILSLAVLLSPVSFVSHSAYAASSDRNGSAPQDAPISLEYVLEKFDIAQREANTMVAEFTERKDLNLLAEPVISQGKFYFNRPNQVRWEYLDPDHRVFVITESKYIAYYPDLKKAEEVGIKKFIGKRLFRYLGVGQSIEDLSKYYNFMLAADNELAGTHLLLLTPRKRRVREKMADMKIWVDTETFMPRQVQYSEVDGDSTLLIFHGLMVNIEVASHRFRVDLPPDVAVSDTFNGFSLGQQSF